MEALNLANICLKISPCLVDDCIAFGTIPPMRRDHEILVGLENHVKIVLVMLPRNERGKDNFFIRTCIFRGGNSAERAG